MGLKPDRTIIHEDTSWFSNDVMERGRVVFGDAIPKMGIERIAHKVWEPGLTPVGLLMVDVVHIDFTRMNIDYYHDNVCTGGKIRLCRYGKIFTNMCQPVEIANTQMYVNRHGKLIIDQNKDICHTPIATYTGRKTFGYREFEVAL